MRRKVIQQNPTTLVVSLPAKWAKANEVTKGDELDISEQEDKLIVSIADQSKRKERTVTLNFNKKHWEIPNKKYKYVQRILAAPYKAGYDEIIIRSDCKEVLEYIEKRVETFIGIEIIDQGRDYFKIKNLVSGLDEEFDNVFRRTLLITNRFATESLEIIKSKEYDDLKNLLRLEKTHNKITDFCKRLLAAKDYDSPKKTRYLYALIAENERLVDEYKDICKYILNSKNPEISKEIVTLLEDTNKLVVQYSNSFFKFDLESIHTLTKGFCKEEETALQLFDKPSTKDKRIVHHILNILTKTYEMGEAFLEMNI
ncbi:phosphate uptake regulator PhoU [Candidatus Woesearchaeota archaeon]|jgi:phosphate uptake regulator|nr:phosphate uptake regulator PhoU [Candidatus Woesearchaeota archaeon]MBT3536996.1 phosphate uptake regulator PhoU [Candidatus Woesearchaeota archaeon]MBT4697606.1 phosphate uptake regulator PhoU [Candidatus Woesearchaeota archaeon]MBT4717720.1 phosphate uptake regulator PhoU [Candidatus Woesearchaeota archaeon]MBT7106694.1 phosphate uptake regulator PhoU [Candidatus Woesearchaeota archaeon]